MITFKSMLFLHNDRALLENVRKHMMSWAFFSLNVLYDPHYVFFGRPLSVTLI